jgi:hypothetical protein
MDRETYKAYSFFCEQYFILFSKIRDESGNLKYPDFDEMREKMSEMYDFPYEFARANLMTYMDELYHKAKNLNAEEKI